MKTLPEIESAFWDIYTEALPDEDIKPLNLDHERSAFFDALSEGMKYNPKFYYRHSNNRKYIDYLSALADAAYKIDDYLGSQYVMHAEKLSDWIKNFDSRDEGFGEWLHSLYARPHPEVVQRAKNKLQSIGYLESEIENSSSMDARGFFSGVLKDYGFSDWRIGHASMPAKIKISSAEKTIFIDEKSHFSERELLRLSVHEIGTHIVRYENGSKQRAIIFKYGFPDYLECEEGLAIFSEENSGHLSDYDIGKYCLRVIASDLAENSSFWEIFTFLQDYVSAEQAFLITTRIKRGLVDTSQGSGYTKDQLYYSGYLKMQQLPKEQIYSLYVGKIGFSQLEQVDFDALALDRIHIPDWVNA